MNEEDFNLKNRFEESVDKQDIYSIKEQILKTLMDIGLSASRLILFGSRGRGNYSSRSDYDILVVTHKDLNVEEKMRIFKRLREDLAGLGFDVDVILKSEKEVAYYMTKCGSVVRNALREGVTL